MIHEHDMNIEREREGLKKEQKAKWNKGKGLKVEFSVRFKFQAISFFMQIHTA